MWVDPTPDLVLRRMMVLTIIIIMKNDNEREVSRNGLEVVIYHWMQSVAVRDVCSKLT